MEPLTAHQEQQAETHGLMLRRFRRQDRRAAQKAAAAAHRAADLPAAARAEPLQADMRSAPEMRNILEVMAERRHLEAIVPQGQAGRLARMVRELPAGQDHRTLGEARGAALGLAGPLEWPQVAQTELRAVNRTTQRRAERLALETAAMVRMVLAAAVARMAQHILVATAATEWNLMLRTVLAAAAVAAADRLEAKAETADLTAAAALAAHIRAATEETVVRV